MNGICTLSSMVYHYYKTHVCKRIKAKNGTLEMKSCITRGTISKFTAKNQWILFYITYILKINQSIHR